MKNKAKRVGKSVSQAGQKNGKFEKFIKLSTEDELEVAIRYIQGMTISELSSEYQISRQRVLDIVRSPLFKEVMKDRQSALGKVIKRVYAKHDADFMRMAELYFKKALDTKEIKKASLGTLFNILEVVSRRYEHMERASIENRKAELELLRLKWEMRALKNELKLAEDGNSQSTSIIGKFVEQMRELATPDLDKKN